jgi:hypothetical protein
MRLALAEDLFALSGFCAWVVPLSDSRRLILRKDPGLLGFSAELVLEEHRKGTLSPPFGKRGAWKAWCLERVVPNMRVNRTQFALGRSLGSPLTRRRVGGPGRSST